MPWKLKSYADLRGHKRAQNRAYNQTSRKLSPELDMAQKIRSRARWRRVAAIARSLMPTCINPFDLHGDDTPTQEIHHIEGLVQRPDLAHDVQNLAGLCKRCHARAEVDPNDAKVKRLVKAKRDQMVALMQRQ